jgi:hypothetical protein
VIGRTETCYRHHGHFGRASVLQLCTFMMRQNVHKGFSFQSFFLSFFLLVSCRQLAQNSEDGRFLLDQQTVDGLGLEGVLDEESLKSASQLGQVHLATESIAPKIKRPEGGSLLSSSSCLRFFFFWIYLFLGNGADLRGLRVEKGSEQCVPQSTLPELAQRLGWVPWSVVGILHHLQRHRGQVHGQSMTLLSFFFFFFPLASLL